MAPKSAHLVADHSARAADPARRSGRGIHGRWRLPCQEVDTAAALSWLGPALSTRRATCRMTWDRVAIVERQLDTYLEHAEPAENRLEARAPLGPGTDLTAAAAIALFEDQLASRQIDVASRELKKTNRSFYTIGSAGHENNAVVGARLRLDDPAFLHYRSGGFVMARARQLSGGTPTLDTLLGLVASRDDPISQGRQMVGGCPAMWIPPQTSTTASRLPKAMGLAFSLARARRIGVAIALPEDAIAVCSFGDASANHATALAAINTARYAVRMGLPMPLLLVCEDNDTGISVTTPEGWIAATDRKSVG